MITEGMGIDSENLGLVYSEMKSQMNEYTKKPSQQHNAKIEQPSEGRKRLNGKSCSSSISCLHSTQDQDLYFYDF
jgi:hypothetical protein